MNFSLFKGSLPTPRPGKVRTGLADFAAPSDVQGVMTMTGRYNHKKSNAVLTCCVTLCALCTYFSGISRQPWEVGILSPTSQWSSQLGCVM